MTRLETLKLRLITLAKQAQAWVIQQWTVWHMQERLQKIKDDVDGLIGRLKARFKNTRAYAKLMALPEMERRMVIMLIGVFLLLGLIFAFNQLKTFMIKQYISGMGMPPQSVSTMVAKADVWQPKLTSVGSVRAYRGVDLSTEIGGLVVNVPVQSGVDVKEGDLLVKLNDASDVAQLNSLKALAELAKVINERDRQQLAIQAISKNTYDTSKADAKSKQAQVEAQTALVAKKNIKAPFSGRVGIVTINPGQYINPGDKLMTLQTLDPSFYRFQFAPK